MFWLIYVTMNIKNVLLWLQWRRLRHWLMPSSITLCSTPSLQLTHQSDSVSNHPHPAFFSARLATPYFEINVLRPRLFSGQKSGSSYNSVTMGGAADFKVGVQNRIRERSERENFFVPQFSKCGVQASKYHDPSRLFRYH